RGRAGRSRDLGDSSRHELQAGRGLGSWPGAQVPPRNARHGGLMAIEIERKFLVTGDGWREAAHAVVPMAQGYLNDQRSLDEGRQRASVRVRLGGDRAFLNIKAGVLGQTRQEIE